MKIRLRRDLEFIRRTVKLNEFWVVKDPVSFNHFLFSNHEFQLLQLFDGKRTDEEIQSQWQRQFRTRSLTMEQVRQFANRLLRDNLVHVDEFGYGRSLFNSRAARKKQQLKSVLLSPLVIRFRGINPGSFLDQIVWIGWLLFHPAVVVFSMFCSFVVLIYMLGHFEELAYRLPTISQLLTTQGILGMAATLSVIKVLHELGHAMACRRCGGECFEIGVILLAFIPTLYCNVSDAWTFPERWKRLLVSFGGVYVEIILATIAAVVWMLTEPGLLNAMTFNVVVLCSINTILINGNPLLRYDGYYLLSDFTEQPNLGTVSRSALGYFVKSLFCVPGKEKNYPVWILVYSILSFFYRWFVVISIVIMVYVFLRSIGLRVVGQYVMLFLAMGIIWRPVMSIRSTIRTAGTSSERSRFSLVRAAFPIAVIGLVAFVYFLIPVPSHVRCNLLVESRFPTPVYASSNGRLTFIADEFETVDLGQTVARIESVELTQQLRRLRNSLDRNRNLLTQLYFRVNQDPQIAVQLVVIQKNIEAIEAELSVLNEEHKKLIVKSPTKGTIYPAPIRESMFSNDGYSKTWQGHLTDGKNLNCYVVRGDQLFSILRAEQKTVTLFVGEREIDFIKKDQPVKMLFVQCPGELFDGVVNEIYEVDVDLNQRLIGDIGMETYQDAAGQLKTLETPYRITVRIDSLPRQAFVGSGGRARISVPAQTLAEKTWKFFDRLATFNL